MLIRKMVVTTKLKSPPGQCALTTSVVNLFGSFLQFFIIKLQRF